VRFLIEKLRSADEYRRATGFDPQAEGDGTR